MMPYLFAFLTGLIIGSFLNVCIYRVPEGRSIVSPASRCPSCGTPIRWYDNIPVLSFLVLSGRCRACGARLSLQYPLVELLNALLYLLVLYRVGYDAVGVAIAYCILISSLLVIFFIDLRHQIIPDGITLPGTVIAIILGAAMLPDPFSPHQVLGLRASLIGALAGGGGFYLIAAAGRMILKKDAMGGGDIKMMAMLGGILGWKGVILTTFLGSLIGSVTGVTLIMWKGREWGGRIPFGPYLAVGALVSLLWGHELLRWYLYAG